MKALCICHASDADGWACAAIFSLYFDSPPTFPFPNDSYRILFASYEDNFDSIMTEINEGEYTDIYMADFSMPTEYMEKISSSHKLHWIDHHPLAIRQNAHVGFSTLAVSTDEKDSACGLLWELLYKDSITSKGLPEIISLIQKGDTYTKDDDWNNVEKLIAYLNSFEKEQATDRIIYSIRMGIIPEWYFDEGGSILRYKKKKIADDAQRARETNINGWWAKVINSAESASGIADYLFKEHPGLPLVVVYYQNGDKWIYSLRGNNHLLDCSEIASLMGGGGHKKAAGFVKDYLLF